MAYSVFRVPNSIQILPTTGNQIVSTVIGGSGQSVDLAQWQNYTGVVLARVDNAGTISGINMTVSGDIAVNGGDITTTATTATLYNTTATTLNIGSAATTTTIGAMNGTVSISGTTQVNTLTATGTINANNGTIATTGTTGNLFNTNATTLNIGGAATTLNIANGTMVSGVVNLGTNNSSGTITLGTSTTNTIIQGNLTVNGTTTTVNSTVIQTNDLNFNLGSNVAGANGSLLDGGGITLGSGASTKTISYVNSNTAWTSSENFDLATSKTYKIATFDVLSATTLGTGVTQSSLTKVGTIGTGVWNGSIIGLGYTEARVASGAVAGTGLSINAATGAITITSNATPGNATGTIVARDSAGNFSAGTITATLTGTATQVSNSLTFGSGLTSSATYNGSAAVTAGLATVTQGSTGTFLKFGYDQYGRVNSNTAVTSGDITTALGYTPVNTTVAVTGVGSSGYLPIWNASAGLTYDAELLYNSTSNTLTAGYANIGSSGVSVATAGTIVDQFATGTFRVAKYLFQTQHSSNVAFQTSEAIVIHDNVSGYITEYGQIYTSGTTPYITLSAGIAGGNVIVSGVSNTGGSCPLRFSRISMSS